jgi:hypothetical protein
MLNFVHQCLSSESMLVFAVVKHAIIHGKADSIAGRNVLLCCSRYNIIIEDVLQLSFRHYNISKRVPYSDIQAATANCLIELLACRDGALQLSHSDFDIRDVITLIDCICTC